MRVRRGGSKGGAGRLGVVLPVLVLVGVVLAGSSPQQHPTTPIYDVALDLNDTHHLYWRLDYGKEEVEFEVHTRGRGRRPWLAVGFSDRGLLEGADLCVLWTDWHGRVHFQVCLCCVGVGILSFCGFVFWKLCGFRFFFIYDVIFLFLCCVFVLRHIWVEFKRLCSA